MPVAYENYNRYLNEAVLPITQTSERDLYPYVAPDLTFECTNFKLSVNFTQVCRYLPSLHIKYKLVYQ